MRYFLNTAAAKPIVLGGFTFEFELVGLRGGSWLGILAVDEPAASVLAKAHPPNTDEISLEVYDLQKKKLLASRPPSRSSPSPTQAEPALTVADPAGSRMLRAVSKPVDHNSTAGVSAVSLLTTLNSPPAEPLLAQTSGKRKPFKL